MSVNKFVNMNRYDIYMFNIFFVSCFNLFVKCRQLGYIRKHLKWPLQYKLAFHYTEITIVALKLDVGVCYSKKFYSWVPL